MSTSALTVEIPAEWDLLSTAQRSDYIRSRQLGATHETAMDDTILAERCSGCDHRETQHAIDVFDGVEYRHIYDDEPRHCLVAGCGCNALEMTDTAEAAWERRTETANR